jgi:hypothetical protein
MGKNQDPVRNRLLYRVSKAFGAVTKQEYAIAMNDVERINIENFDSRRFCRHGTDELNR